MSKKTLLNLVLFIFVIFLASVIYLSEEENSALRKLTDIDLNDITSINIRHNKNNSIIVKQKNNQWQITQPIKIAANDFRIQSILKLLNAPVHNKYSLVEIDTNTIDLKQPQTSIQFNNITIEFGISNPVTNLRYVKLNDHVYTIEDVYYPLLSSDFSTLVSLNLLPKSSSIKKLILINQTITKDGKGFWQSNIDLSADNINKTIDHWQNDQAFGVHEYLQRDTLGEVFIFTKDQQQPISYLITDTDPWLILARPEMGLEYHLNIFQNNFNTSKQFPIIIYYFCMPIEKFA